MSTTLLYALILAIAQIVVTLTKFFLGYETDKINSGAWFGIVPVVVSIVVLILGIKAVREEKNEGYLTYGQGVGAGVLISLYAGLIGAVYAYIHFSWVNTNFTDYMIEASRIKWAAAGMQEAQMDGGEKIIRFTTKPLFIAALYPVMSVIFGLILSLIISAFLKRNPPGEGKVAA